MGGPRLHAPIACPPGTPAVRGGALRDDLDLLEKHRAGLRDKVLGRIPAPLSRWFLESTRAEWCPLDAGGCLTDSTLEVLGERQAYRFWVTGVTDHLLRPLLRPFVVGVKLIFHSEPARMVDMVPRGWCQIYRDACRVRVEHPGEGIATVFLDDIAREVASRPSYLLNWRARFEGIAATLDDQARLEWVEADDKRSVEAHFRW